MSAEKRATLYRMDTPELTCAFGLKARDLLKSRGYSIDEHVLTSRTEVDAFKRSHGVATTPQTFIDGSGSVDLTICRNSFAPTKAHDLASGIPCLIRRPTRVTSHCAFWRTGIGP